MEQTVDWFGHKGLGPWLKARRLELGMTQESVCAAASVTQRMLQRYEADEGVGYETLRILRALGVTLSPAPPEESPGALNAEVRRLRLQIEASAAERSATIAKMQSEVRRGAELLTQILDELESDEGTAPADEGSPPSAAHG